MATNPYKILGIKKDASIEDIKKAFIILAKKYHPDSNNGKYSEKFQQIKEAKDKVLQNRKDLITLSEKSVIKKEIYSNMIELFKNQEKKDLSTRKRELISLEKNKLNQKLNPIKITSTSVFVILTFLYYLPSNILDSPILGEFLRIIIYNDFFGIIWSISLFYTGIIWLFLLIKEKKYLEKIEKIMERENMEKIYQKLKIKFKKNKFSKDQFIKHILGQNYYYKDKSILNFYLFTSTIFKFNEDIINTILNEFLSKQVIERVKGNNLDDWYKVV